MMSALGCSLACWSADESSCRQPETASGGAFRQLLTIPTRIRYALICLPFPSFQQASPQAPHCCMSCPRKYCSIARACTRYSCIILHHPSQLLVNRAPLSLQRHYGLIILLRQTVSLLVKSILSFSAVVAELAPANCSVNRERCWAICASILF